MKALAQLGLKVNGEIPLDILLSENFNGSLYGMTQEESAKVRALRQVVTVQQDSFIGQLKAGDGFKKGR